MQRSQAYSDPAHACAIIDSQSLVITVSILHLSETLLWRMILQFAFDTWMRAFLIFFTSSISSSPRCFRRHNLLGVVSLRSGPHLSCLHGLNVLGVYLIHQRCCAHPGFLMIQRFDSYLLGSAVFANLCVPCSVVYGIQLSGLQAKLHQPR